MDNNKIQELLEQMTASLREALEAIEAISEEFTVPEEPVEPPEEPEEPPTIPEDPELEFSLTLVNETTIKVEYEDILQDPVDILFNSDVRIDKHGLDSWMSFKDLVKRYPKKTGDLLGGLTPGAEYFVKLSYADQETAQKSLNIPEPLDFKLEKVSEDSVKLTWNSDRDDIDILFTNTVRREKGHDPEWMSFKNLVERYPEQGGDYVRKLAMGRVHYFKLGGIDSKVLELDLRQEVEDEDLPKKITVNEDSKGGIYTPAVNGFFKHNGKYRLYAWNRRQSEMLYFESENLEDWSKPKRAGIQDRGNYKKLRNGDVLFYRGKDKDKGETGDEIRVYKVSSDLNSMSFISSYDWRLDGALLMNDTNGTIRATGRVRGSKDKDSGGWGSDLPDYPTVENIPQIKEAFNKYAPSGLKESAIDEVLKDRRGISLHTSKDNGKTWSNGKIIAAPEWYDTPETEGWNKEKANGIGDFYSSVLIDEKRMLVKLYKKEKDRVIERGAGDMDYPFHRRFRFTGETIIVPGIFENGRVSLLNNKSIIPREFHDRKTPKEVPNATCKDCVEFGQTSPYGILEQGDYVYVIYGYRDDIHYEADFDFYAGVYLAKFTKSEFNKIFN